MSKKTYIDLFSGCGGLALGLHKAGWKGVFAVEKSADAFKTLEHNLIKKKSHFDWPNWLPQQAHDINDLLANYYNEIKSYRGIDLIAGGPPCQGFSRAGRRQHDDIRNQLTHSYIEFVKLVMPKMIFFENVLGFTEDFSLDDGQKKNFSFEVEDQLARLGYKIERRLVDFSKFGVPQKRTRYILVGTLGSSNSFFAGLEDLRLGFLQNKGINSPVSLQDAIGDLLKKNGTFSSPDSKGFKAGKYSEPGSVYQKLMREGAKEIPDSHRFANHRKDTVSKLRFGIKTGMHGKNIAKLITEKFGGKKSQINLLNPMEPSPTLTTLTDDFIHFAEPRNLSVREYARIQSFPDDFEFLGPYTTGGAQRKVQVPRYTQIGNAIPPLFGEISGLALKKAC